MATDTQKTTAAGKLATKENTANITAREQIVTVPAFSLLDLEFENTMPNYVYINNYSGNMLYFGRSVLPSSTVYDMTIPGNSDNLYASPNSFYKAYLYNGSGSDAQAKITSFVAPFQPAALKGGAGGTTGGGGGGPATDVNATITSFNTPLPTGANVIGHVVVDSMPAQTINQSLGTGSNHIGSVSIDGGLPALATGSSHIGSVGIDGGVTISSMPPVTVSSSPVATQHIYYDGNIDSAVTAGVVFTLTAPINTINFIKNDGTTDVFIGFDGTDPSNPANRASGTNMVIRLQAGEGLDNFGRKISTQVNFWRSTGAGVVRFLGA